MTTYYEEYSKVLVSVDCIIFGFDEGELKILIGKRKMDPGRDQWSLYGGFIHDEESVDDAANRVLFQLTGLRNIYMRQVGAFGNVDRDPGERVISIAYYALINAQLATESFDAKRSWGAVFRESKIGLGTGIFMALLAYIGVMFLSHNSMLATVMGVALLLDMLLGAMAGGAIPLVLRALGRDPAQASSIFLTALTDSGGFFIFLGLATTFLL